MDGAKGLDSEGLMRNLNLKIVVCGLIVGWLGMSCPSASLAQSTSAQSTSNRADAFLQAARERGFYEAAEYYLDKLEQSPATSPEFKKGIPFRRSQIIFEKTQTLANINDQRQALEAAVVLANEHLANSSDLNERLQAVQLITQIHSRFAEYQRRQAQRPWEQLYESPNHAEEVRKELGKVADAYERGAELIMDELREANRSSDAARRVAMDENRARFLTHLVMKMLTLDRIALSYAPESDEFKQKHEALVKENAEYAAKYQSPAPFDMYFRMYQVKCLLRLGRWQEASPIIDDILFQSSAVYDALKREVVLLGFEIWFREPPYKIELAIKQLEEVVKKLSDAELQNELVQKIYLALAKAHHERSVFGATIDRPTPEQRSLTNTSSRLRLDIARRLIRLNTPIAAEARELLQQWGGRGPAEKVSEVNTFAEAKQRGLDLLTEAIETSNELGNLTPEELANPEIQQRQAEFTTIVDQTLNWFDRSLELADAETRRVDLNMVRFFQVQAYTLKGYYLEAALIGKFLLDRFPNEVGTAEAAALAAKALERLTYERKTAGEPVDVEQEQMIQVCQTIIQRWPERKEAGDVAFLLLNTYLSQQNLPAAMAVLNSLSSDNPSRPRAELQLGLASSQAAEALQRTEGEEQNVERLWQQAEQLLRAGLAGGESEFTSLHFTGAAFLAQLLNRQGLYAETIQLLEQSPTASVRRVEENDPLITDLNVQTSVIQNAVIAYMGTLGSDGDLLEVTDRVNVLLGVLQEKLQDNPRASSILQTYYQRTLQRLREVAGGNLNDDARKNLASATIKIFEPIIGPADDWRLLTILGDTVLDLANSLPVSERPLRSQAFEIASKSYEKSLSLLAKVTDDPSVPAQRTNIEIKSAASLRGQGKHEQAQSRLNELLKNHPKNPLVQIELCQNYQAWGIASKNRDHLRTALMGQGQMWGWQKLAQATISDTKNRDVFYQALFGMATCRFQFGKIANDEKYVEAALSAVRNQWERDKTMGGDHSKARFDQLTREIQQQLKRPVNGLAGI